jgi:hypothetical protein
MAYQPMSKRKRKPLCLLLLAALCLAATLLAGCATADYNESDIPWNTPQPWEGSPMIPGFDGR